MKAWCVVLWLCRVPLVYASDIPLDVLTAWGQALRHATITRVDGRFVPVSAHEGERQPLFYRFLPARPRQHSPVMDYVAEPTAQLRWGRQTYHVAEIPSAWGFTHDHLPWSWPTRVPYQLRVGGRVSTCVEAHFAGLGMSGSAQRYKAVLVVEATQAVEHLYFSGYGAGCALVGDYTGDRRLGSVHCTPRTSDMYAHVMTVTGPRQVRAQRAYAVRAVSVGQGPTRVQARPITPGACHNHARALTSLVALQVAHASQTVAEMPVHAQMCLPQAPQSPVVHGGDSARPPLPPYSPTHSS